VDDAAFAAVIPKTDSINVVVRDPNGVVMAVRFRIVRVTHARDRSARWTDEWKNERPSKVLSKMISSNLQPIALKGNLVIRLRDHLPRGPLATSVRASALLHNKLR
jgi:hypothetical protein